MNQHFLQLSRFDFFFTGKANKFHQRMHLNVLINQSNCDILSDFPQMQRYLTHLSCCFHQKLFKNNNTKINLWQPLSIKPNLWCKMMQDGPASFERNQWFPFITLALERNLLRNLMAFRASYWPWRHTAEGGFLFPVTGGGRWLRGGGCDNGLWGRRPLV